MKVYVDPEFKFTKINFAQCLRLNYFTRNYASGKRSNFAAAGNIDTKQNETMHI